MAGPIKRILQRRQARKRLARLVESDRKANAPKVHADQLELRTQQAKLTSGQKLLRRGNKVYGAASFLMGSGAAEYGAMAAVVAGSFRAAGHTRTMKAREGIQRATKAIIDRRLGKETEQERIKRRLAGKPKKRNIK